MMLPNPEGKTITAMNSFSPMYQLDQKYSHDPPRPADWLEHLPDVSRQSDVLWILWKDVAGAKAGDIKWVISTPESRSSSDLDPRKMLPWEND